MRKNGAPMPKSGSQGKSGTRKLGSYESRPLLRMTTTARHRSANIMSWNALASLAMRSGSSARMMKTITPTVSRIETSGVPKRETLAKPLGRSWSRLMAIG